jgi:AcrR family transcriptional regulator
MREILTNIKKPELVAKRRNQIMKTAMKLFRRNGYHATTMREICKHARVNMGSFYDYFGSKQDILVYIYKEMIFGGRVYDQAFPEENVSTWNDLEPFLKSLTFNAWNRHKNPIQLLYRETISLDKGTMREVLKIESEYVRWIAENLRKGLGRSSVDQELEIIANSIALINAFLPLRGWNMHHLDQERILDSIVDMLMSKLKALRRHPPRSGSV